MAAVLFCSSIFLVSCFLSVTVFTATFLFFYVSLLVHSLTFGLNFSWSGYLLELYNQRKEPVFQVVETSLYDRVACFTSPKPIKTCLAGPLTVQVLPPPYHQDRLLLPHFQACVLCGLSVWVFVASLVPFFLAKLGLVLSAEWHSAHRRGTHHGLRALRA